MNFQPELAALVMSGHKTVTRRLVSDNPRSPWWREACALQVGRDYAVCPGRGKNQIGRVRIVNVKAQPLGGSLIAGEAAREGFAHHHAFEVAWAKINGSYDSTVMVWRVAFEVVA